MSEAGGFFESPLDDDKADDVVSDPAGALVLEVAAAAGSSVDEAAVVTIEMIVGTTEA